MFPSLSTTQTPCPTIRKFPFSWGEEMKRKRERDALMNDIFLKKGMAVSSLPALGGRLPSTILWRSASRSSNRIVCLSCGEVCLERTPAGSFTIRLFIYHSQSEMSIELVFFFIYGFIHRHGVPPLHRSSILPPKRLRLFVHLASYKKPKCPEQDNKEILGINQSLRPRASLAFPGHRRDRQCPGPCVAWTGPKR